MQFFGYGVGDWASLITLTGTILSVIIYLIKKMIFDPYIKEMQEVKKSIDQLTTQMKNQHDETIDMHEETKRKLDAQKEELFKHDKRIKVLEVELDNKGAKI